VIIYDALCVILDGERGTPRSAPPWSPNRREGMRLLARLWWRHSWPKNRPRGCDVGQSRSVAATRGDLRCHGAAATRDDRADVGGEVAPPGRRDV